MNTIALTQYPPVRLFGSGFLALFITLVLFFLMKNLIESDRSFNVEAQLSPPITWVEPKEMDPLSNTRHKIAKPVEPQNVPKEPEVKFFESDPVDFTTTIKKPVVKGNIIGGLVDGPPMATVVLQPRYPHRALTDKVEGYAIVEFDISKTGQVLNPRVVESSPGTIFNRSSLDAISKFRYKPKVVNGEPLIYVGAYYRFTYEMTKPS